jgi:hypothetical protein
MLAHGFIETDYKSFDICFRIANPKKRKGFTEEDCKSLEFASDLRSKIAVQKQYSNLF